MNKNNYQKAAELLENVDKLHAEKKSLTRVSSAKKPKPDNPVGSSTDSPNRKSPEELMDEARRLLWENVKYLIVTNENACIIFDDSVLDKRYSEEIEMGSLPIKKYNKLLHKLSEIVMGIVNVNLLPPLLMSKSLLVYSQPVA